MPNLDEINAYRNRLKAAAAQLKASLLGKDEIIDMMFVCAIAQEPMLIFGPPGTAKSKLATMFCDFLGIKSAASANYKNHEPFYFSYLLTGFTEPDELFGPVNLNTLKNEGRYVREKRDQMMPGATAIFLDEVFRANSTILNTLLTLINERYVYEDGTPQPAKANIVFGAANLPPTREDLAAFYARFPIRMYSDQVPFTRVQNGVDQGRELVKRGWKLEHARMASTAAGAATPAPIPGPARPAGTSGFTDLLFLQKCLMDHWQVDGAAWKELEQRPAYELFIQMVRQLRGEDPESNNWLQVSLDDRKVVKEMLKLFLARALWLRDDPFRPDYRDLLIFKHIANDMREDSRYRLAQSVRTQIHGFMLKMNRNDPAFRELNRSDPEDSEILDAA